MANQKTPTEPSAIVLPFGKHKGKTVAELLATDPQYADWVAAQSWVAERFAELHAAILTKGAGTDDTPEHNAIQARFLDEAFRLALLRVTSTDKIIAARTECLNYETYKLRVEMREIRDKLARVVSNIEWRRGQATEHQKYYLKTLEEETAEEAALRSQLALLEERRARWPFKEWALKTAVRFEQEGIDVRLDAGFLKSPGPAEIGIAVLVVEIKPTIGDDYPTVMRQMRRLGAKILLVDTYTGRGVSEPQMRAMFEASAIKVVFIQEIEERMRQSD